MDKKKIKTIFFGAGIFAREILEGIVNYDFLDIVAVVTQPDKPAGRKQELKPCEVKELINEHPEWEFKVYQPIKLKLEAEKILEETKPEFVLVADYSQMIPKSIIDYPKYKCLNVHGSLLPDLRGAVPVPVAILKGYKLTGVSIPIMTPGLDDGDVVVSCELDILPEDTTYSLRLELAQTAVELMEKVLPQWFEGGLKPEPQDQSKATYTFEKDIAKEKARIDKNTSVEMADRMIRAFIPWPIAWCEVELNGKRKRVKIHKAEIIKDLQLEPGAFRKHEKNLYLALKDGVLLIHRVQLEGKPIMFGNEALFLANIKLI
jgi:methionyl-tRNA formyltransferase